MSLINLRDITVAFGGPPLFDGISLQIEPGDRMCLMGRNGTGKSTLLRLIAGEITPEGGEIQRQRMSWIAELRLPCGLEPWNYIYPLNAENIFKEEANNAE